MNDFMDVLTRAGSDPMSWIVVGLLGLWVCVSVIVLFTCPVLHARRTVSQADANRLINQRVRHPLGFLLAMLCGMCMAVAGLFGLAGETSGGLLPFFLLATGLFIVLTLPVRFAIQDARLRVIAARTDDSRAVLTRILRQTHQKLIGFEAGVVALLSAVLLVY